MLLKIVLTIRRQVYDQTLSCLVDDKTLAHQSPGFLAIHHLDGESGWLSDGEVQEGMKETNKVLKPEESGS